MRLPAHHHLHGKGKEDVTVEFLKGVKIHPDLALFQLAFIEAKVVELGPEQARLAYSSNAHVSVFARNYLRIRFQDWVSRGVLLSSSSLCNLPTSPSTV